MSELLFHCPHCASIMAVESSLAGRQVACPTCEGVVTIPVQELAAFPPMPPNSPPREPCAPPVEQYVPPPQVPPPAEYYPTQEALATLNCPLCAGIFQVLPSSQEQTVACPHCGGHVLVGVQLSLPTGVQLGPVGPMEPAGLVSPTDPIRPLITPSVVAPTRSLSKKNRPIPVSPTPQPAAPESVAPLATDDGQIVALHEPVKTVGRPGAEVELRRLTPEEKARRRLTRNIVMVTACLALLLIVIVVLLQRG